MAGILVVGEHLQGEVRDITGEMIGAAVALKDKIGGPVTVLLVGADAPSLVEKVNLEGVDEIVTVATEAAHFDPNLYEEAVCQIGAQNEPRAIFMGHSVNGMAFGAAVAARLGAGFASDVFGVDAEGADIVAIRSGYGAKVQMELVFPEKTVVALTLRGATFEAPETPGSATITAVDVDMSAVTAVSSHVEYRDPPPADFDITKAEFILSIGRGIEDPDNVPRFKELAERLGATLGCSRPVADSGWLPKPHQVGQSGKVASNCKLYIALGISGAVQHLFGMKHVETIIAINTDSDAPMYNYATYGATMSLFDFADALEKQFN
jgi:electron transfer flavoprotein alpha subunit